MSSLEELRRQKEEADRLAQQRQEEGQRARIELDRIAEEEKARIKAEKDSARAFYEESEFPRLIEEFPGLIAYDPRVEPSFSYLKGYWDNEDRPWRGDSSKYADETTTRVDAIDQSIFINHSVRSYNGHSVRDSYTASIQVQVDPHSVIWVQIWAIATPTPIPQSRLQHLFSPATPIPQEPSYRGFAIEATPQGDIITHGAEENVLSLEEWRGNPAIQEQALEQVYENPFVVQHTHLSSGHTGGRQEHPYPTNA